MAASNRNHGEGDGAPSDGRVEDGLPAKDVGERTQGGRGWNSVGKVFMSALCLRCVLMS